MSDQPRTTRRAFLKGRSAAEAAVHAAQSLADGLDFSTVSAERAPASYLVHIGRRAMACQFECLLNAGQYEQGTERAIEALDLVDRLESQMTVYRDDSEISVINAQAFEHEMPVESRLFGLLQQAIGINHDTGGAHDITAGPLSKVWGFYRRQGSVPVQADLDAALARVGCRHLILDVDRTSIRFAIEGIEINLGSIGKGYALDRCAELLEADGVDDFIFHGGQSSVLARGSQGSGDGWKVGLRHPLQANRRLAEIRLRNRALGTSGSGTQFFLQQGKRYGHILDPRTGWPAETVISSTVLAPTAALADALSTAFYVLGPETAIEYCRTRPQIAAILLTSGRGGASLQVDSVGLEDDELYFLEDVELAV